MKEKVSEFTGRSKKQPDTVEAEFFNDLDKVMKKYESKVTMATMVGMLDVMKTNIMINSMAMAQETH